MALINCVECGKEISNQAPSCPYCGIPIEKEKRKVIIELDKKSIVLKPAITGLSKPRAYIDDTYIGDFNGEKLKFEIDIPIGEHNFILSYEEGTPTIGTLLVMPIALYGLAGAGAKQRQIIERFTINEDTKVTYIFITNVLKIEITQSTEEKNIEINNGTISTEIISEEKTKNVEVNDELILKENISQEKNENEIKQIITNDSINLPIDTMNSQTFINKEENNQINNDENINLLKNEMNEVETITAEETVDNTEFAQEIKQNEFIKEEIETSQMFINKEENNQINNDENINLLKNEIENLKISIQENTNLQNENELLKEKVNSLENEKLKLNNKLDNQKTKYNNLITEKRNEILKKTIDKTLTTTQKILLTIINIIRYLFVGILTITFLLKFSTDPIFSIKMLIFVLTLCPYTYKLLLKKLTIKTKYKIIIQIILPIIALFILFIIFS